MTTTVRDPFTELAATPREHFKLLFYFAVLQLQERLGDLPADVFPFLSGYEQELGVRRDLDAARWGEELARWERRARVRLPVRDLGCTPFEELVLFTVGLVEEDPRFARVWEAVHDTRGAYRPTLGSLTGWWAPPDRRDDTRVAVRRLLELGLLERCEPAADAALQVTQLLWDAARGDVGGAVADWAAFRPTEELPTLEELVAPDELKRAVASLPALLADGETRALVVRGPAAAGRRTLVGALAHACGRGVLEVAGLSLPDDPRWRTVGPLATLLDAIPLTALELAPGETVQLPRLPACTAPLALAIGRTGGIDGPGAESAITLSLELPSPDARRAHWRAALGSSPLVEPLAARYRMTGGNIRRAGRLAHAEAALAGRSDVAAADVRAARRALHSQALDVLAERVEVDGSWADLAASADTLNELILLEARCRHRERLQGTGRAATGPGVRALFSGPSGTGKTLAARLLAAKLGLDLYRLDLSSVVDKYLGETEKNLSRVFARAEELDVILLLDEGDALLTRRTDVHTSNDRYANLETNYLLQRFESFEGILVVTTNAGDRIDGAFERRMDVVVEFRAPDVAARCSIWELHLPPTHLLAPDELQEVALRCALTGGQIRNAVVHATLLALDDGGAIDRVHLHEAVRREYRKAGEVCPLR